MVAFIEKGKRQADPVREDASDTDRSDHYPEFRPASIQPCDAPDTKEIINEQNKKIIELESELAMYRALTHGARLGGHICTTES